MITFEKVYETMGAVIAVLYRARYPEGTTMEQLRQDAGEHRWIFDLVEALEDG